MDDHLAIKVARRSSATAYQRILGRNELHRPSFSKYWTLPQQPDAMSMIDERSILGGKAQLYLEEDAGRYWYHLLPEEQTLSVEEAGLCLHVLDRVLAEPPASIGNDVHEVRAQVVSRCFMHFRRAGLELGRCQKLAEIIGRNTAGLGLLETMIADERIEDIYIDSPAESNPIHITMSREGHMINCVTNVYASNEGLAGLMSRLRRYGGRPFSEAFPVLETEIPGMGVRFTAVGPPISPSGPALALRRHSTSVWTLTRLILAGMLDTKAAALLSLLLDGGCTVLVCGPRGAGKTSLLAALMLELPKERRIITIEDTLELPVHRMQQLGYKVQRLQVDTSREAAIDPSLALRTSLRLGESAIVMGEVRGEEAKILYESMRAGKTASAVLGTIHGDSANSVYDRVVHDMGISPGAFASTDAVVTLGLVRPSGGMQVSRSLIGISEYLPGKGFSPLLGASPMSRGNSPLLQRIALAWGIDMAALEASLSLRAELRDSLVRSARTNPDRSGPVWTARLNELVRRVSGEGGVARAEFSRMLREGSE
jgi:type IV secretory pathway ATPase VirB11/archaellum biosynthesis ATPase